MDVREISIIYHVGLVIGLLWICSSFNWCHPVLYFASLIYLYQVHEVYIKRLRKKLQYEERKQANQKRVLSDSETVRWLNHAVEKVWPICMEQITSQKILLPIVPWFLEKYKPWTAKEAVVQHMYLGRNPPMFTDMRVCRQSSDDDHLVLELGMNFLTADDMSAILAVKLRRRLGFGMWAKLHVTGMHVEGKVLVGVKFLREWPFLGRLRVCFVEPPYFSMTVKPIVSHGIDVTELPGIAGWLDKLLSVAFEQTLVEPNMLVVDVQKFASPSAESWFTVDEKDPIAYVRVEVIEGADMKPSDPNGLADPYVKGRLGPYRFRTKTQKKTLTPKWQEEFKIPICTWESPNILVLEVRDKDHFVDDTLGDCTVNIGDARDGQRRDMWIALKNIKIGRLHVAITVFDVNEKGGDSMRDDNEPDKKDIPSSDKKTVRQDMPSSDKKTDKQDIPSDKKTDKKDLPSTDVNGTGKDFPSSTVPSKKDQKIADDFEPINIEGQQETGIWVHHPGSDVSQTWEPRKRTRQADIQIKREENNSFNSHRSTASCTSSSDENAEGSRSKTGGGTVRRSLRKIGSVFHRSPRSENSSVSGDPSPSPRYVNVRAVNEKGTILNIVRDDDTSGIMKGSKAAECVSPEANDVMTPGKGNMKGMAKSILKHAEHGLKHVLSRKGSKLSKSDTACAMEDQPETDSSEESSRSSSFRNKQVPSDISVDSPRPCADGVKSPDSKEENDQINMSDPPRFEESPPKTVTFETIEGTAIPQHGALPKEPITPIATSDNRKGVYEEKPLQEPEQR